MGAKIKAKRWWSFKARRNAKLMQEIYDYHETEIHKKARKVWIDSMLYGGSGGVPHPYYRPKRTK